MPTVSIIMPVYNKSRYIKETLNSILQQTYNDYEVIVINDGSNDNSLEIIKECQRTNDRISIIDIPNGGVSQARNIGLNYAQGKWVQFLDGDDLIDKEYLKNAVLMAEKFQADILFSNFKMVGETGELKKEVISTYEGLVNYEKLCKLFLEVQYENGFFGFISNKLIRKDIIEKSNARFRPGLRLAEDLDFYVQIYPYVNSAYFSILNSFYYLQTENNYINDQNIDYYSQIGIQLRIKQWFFQTEFCELYGEFLNKKVAEYVFFTLFHSNDSLKNEYEKIVNNHAIMECINLQSFSKYSKWVLSAVKHKNYYMLSLLLNGRNVIRNIYRRLRHGTNLFI